MTSKITFAEFIAELTKELNENEDWGDKELEFSTINRDGLEFLSVYDTDSGICIDVGTEKDSEEWNKFALLI